MLRSSWSGVSAAAHGPDAISLMKNSVRSRRRHARPATAIHWLRPAGEGRDKMKFNRRELALAALAASCAPRGAPDLIVHGGRIYTGVAAAPTVEAVRISGGRFVVAGSLAGARARSAGAGEIDLRGAAAFPGFTDSHVHLTGVGMAALRL